ncbi:MAG: cytidylate kinase [Syntrophus sp. PtaU1.Bin005]|jgi:cytidylate kinase|uniref:cytidylate kinase-like family protein n=1 Tax=Syntrophus TaxID=43773 RepID=UPI0009C76BD2|nr:MAG: cytidylate kinase [Syntrophus sp. PtaB.Bin138]OPY83020.1 MAG: cytidylate kinase [Syntrophus sp. PtaU1.Bin005]
MAGETKYCAICAWRENCQKRYSVRTDIMGNVYCNEFTRDLTLKRKEEVEEQNREAASRIERYIESQLQRMKNLSEQELKEGASGGVITISREAGACGTEIAQRLSRELNMELMNNQIIDYVAESAQISKRVIESLDEKEVSRRDAWIASFFEHKHLWPDQYLDHLIKIIATIGRYGNAIIVGRGAHYILPPEKLFRIRLVAPLEDRIAHIMKVQNATRKEAEKYVLKTDNDRQAFIRKYFHMDMTDPGHYDLLINMRIITVDGAVEAIKAAFLKRKGLEAASPAA